MKYFNQYIDDLKTLISFKSTLGAPEDNAPFGAENKKALDFFLSRAKDFGFKTINYDGYAGEVIFGEGEEIGVIGHLDVVPVGIGWNTDPWTLTKIDGVYYGRGVSDDKLPLLSCLYALREIKESNIVPTRKIRLFVGCNEETGWQDIEYLKTKTVMPEYGFSPDGNFPLSYAEKGILIAKFNLPTLKNFYDLKGGTAVNAVCDYASVRARTGGIDKTLLDKFNLKLSDGNLIESFGKAAHGSTPHLGKNALLPLFSYFTAVGEDFSKITDCLFLDKHGISNLTNEQGKVTFSPNIIEPDGDGFTLACDCRIPAPLSPKDVTDILDGFNLKYFAEEKHPPVMVEKDGWFVQTLLGAYNAVTGDNAAPISMGGSTFARAFKKGCAFGPKFNGHDDKIHDANENIPEENLLNAFKIYKLALEKLLTE